MGEKTRESHGGWQVDGRWMEREWEGANYCNRVNARREEGRGIYGSLWGILPQRCLTHEATTEIIPHLPPSSTAQTIPYHTRLALYGQFQMTPTITVRKTATSTFPLLRHPPPNQPYRLPSTTTPLADLPTGRCASRSTAWCWFVGMGDADAVRVMRLRGCVVGWYGGGAWWEARWKGDRRLGARW